MSNLSLLFKIQSKFVQIVRPNRKNFWFNIKVKWNECLQKQSFAVYYKPHTVQMQYLCKVHLHKQAPF